MQKIFSMLGCDFSVKKIFLFHADDCGWAAIVLKDEPQRRFFAVNQTQVYKISAYVSVTENLEK